MSLIDELDKKLSGRTSETIGAESVLRGETADLLRTEVAAMNVDNFVVRPKRRFVEKYAKPSAWTDLPAHALAELATEVAGLPTELDAEEEEAKRFDLLLLNLQLALLRIEPRFKRLRNQLIAIAGLLEEKATIPMVREQLALIQEVQSDEWWPDVTVQMLEGVRRRLRLLVKFIEKRSRKPVFTDFEDVMGSETNVDLPGFPAMPSFEKFRDKVRAFLREHQDHLTIRKLRMNQPLTAVDLAELQRILELHCIANLDQLAKAKAECKGLGLFVRSLVGLDRDAAKEALNRFTAGKTFKASQIEFVNMVVDHLTENGAMDPSLLYDSPFTDVAPKGPEDLFSSPQIKQLLSVLNEVRDRAIA